MSNGNAKKGLHPLAWVAIGCGGLVIVVGLILALLAGFGIYKGKQFIEEHKGNPEMAAAEIIVRAADELELVEKDVDAGTLTIRNTKTGEVFTADVSEIRQGKLDVLTGEGEKVSIQGGEQGLTVTGAEGEEVFHAGAAKEEDLPEWIPRYPGAVAEGVFSMRQQGTRTGAFTLTTGDPVEEVMAFYERELPGAGLEIERRTTSTTDGDTTGHLMARSTDPKREVNVILAPQDGATQVTIQYSGS